MDWDIVLGWLAANMLPLAIGCVVGGLWYGLIWAEGKAVKRLREYADTLTPAQHDAIETFINRAHEKFDALTGPERMELVLAWMKDNKIPVNRVYVQAVYNFCKRQWGAKEAS